MVAIIKLQDKIAIIRVWFKIKNLTISTSDEAHQKCGENVQEFLSNVNQIAIVYIWNMDY